MLPRKGRKVLEISGRHHASPRERRGVLAIGGFAEHVVLLDHRYSPEEPRTQLLRFGPELRVGGGRRVFAYAHARLGLELLFIHKRPDLGLMSTLGCGVQGLATERLLMGAEVGVDVSFYGVNGLFPMARLRVFTGFKF